MKLILLMSQKACDTALNMKIEASFDLIVPLRLKIFLEELS